jgi:predicted nucleic acid-binding protein
MILVDTSVLVDYLRAPSDRVLHSLETQSAAICGVIRAELMAGVKSPADAARIAAAVDSLDYLPTPEEAWELLGENLSRLRAAGVSVPLSDALIATLAIEYGVQVWTRDAHFERIRGVIPLLSLMPEPV